jgi:hypothetical protein
MIYKGREIDIQSGDIILFRNEFVWSRPRTYLSTAIRGFTKCYYNHSGIIVNDWDTLMINESLIEGVISRPLEQHIERSKTKILVRRPKVPLVEKDFCSRANSKLGIPYGFKDLLLNEPLYRIFGIWLGHTSEHAEKAMVCTQYIAWCHKLENWWLYSDRELLESDYFVTTYQEK